MFWRMDAARGGEGRSSESGLDPSAGGRAARCGGAGEVGLAAGARQQPVVADAMKPLWQNVEQEAPDELVGTERHCTVPRLAIAAVILVAERHTALVETDQPAV